MKFYKNNYDFDELYINQSPKSESSDYSSIYLDAGEHVFWMWDLWISAEQFFDRFFMDIFHLECVNRWEGWYPVIRWWSSSTKEEDSKLNDIKMFSSIDPSFIPCQIVKPLDEARASRKEGSMQIFLTCCSRLSRSSSPTGWIAQVFFHLRQFPPVDESTRGGISDKVALFQSSSLFELLSCPNSGWSQHVMESSH